MAVFSSFEFGVARRYMTSGRRDGFISFTTIISIITIALGVTALIVVMSIMNGFRAQLLETVLGYHGHIIVQDHDREIDNYRTLETRLSAIDGVVRTLPFVENFAMATNGNNAVGAIVRGLPDDRFTQESLGIKDVRSGKLEDAVDVGGVILGYQLARRLGVRPGDEITLLSSKMIATPFGSTFRYVNYPVSAIVEIGVYQFDESFIGMPLSDAQIFFQMKDTVTTVEVFLENPEMVDEMEATFISATKGFGIVTHWKRFNRALVGSLDVERIMMFMVMSLIIIVAAFNITTSLIMLVKDRAGDIAIMRTMGATERSIRRIFLITGMSIGLMGVISGMILSGLILYFIEPIKNFIQLVLGINVWDPSVRIITELTVVVDTGEVIITILLALFLTFMATIFPAMRAARTDPVQVLRSE